MRSFFTYPITLDASPDLWTFRSRHATFTCRATVTIRLTDAPRYRIGAIGGVWGGDGTRPTAADLVHWAEIPLFASVPEMPVAADKLQYLGTFVRFGLSRVLPALHSPLIVVTVRGATAFAPLFVGYERPLLEFLLRDAGVYHVRFEENPS